jgi:uncharacterized protein (UPF0335 family)
MVKFGGFSGDQLRMFVDKIEKLEAEKKQIGEFIKEIFSEAKSQGFDVKILRKVLSIRKIDPRDREEQDTILDLYLHALGMIPGDEDAEDEQEAA